MVNKMSGESKKRLTIVIAILLVIIILVAPLISINISFIKINILKIFKNQENAINYLQYFGTLVGGFSTLIALYITVKQTRLIQEEQNRKMAEEEQNQIKAHTFIIINDLKNCFSDIFKILIRYAEVNGTLSIQKDDEKKVKFLIMWKEILDLYVYSESWRESLKVISKKIDKVTIEKIYNIYLMLEKRKNYINSIQLDIKYDELATKIALLPKEQIFKKEFVDRYSSLIKLIDIKHNDYSQNQLESSKYEIEKIYIKKNILDELKYFECQLHKVYNKKHIVYLDEVNDEWKKIFEYLESFL
ncbi:hypothetical protein [Clostridium senegalense]